MLTNPCVFGLQVAEDVSTKGVAPTEEAMSKAEAVKAEIAAKQASACPLPHDYASAFIKAMYRASACCVSLFPKFGLWCGWMLDRQLLGSKH